MASGGAWVSTASQSQITILDASLSFIPYIPSISKSNHFCPQITLKSVPFPLYPQLFPSQSCNYFLLGPWHISQGKSHFPFIPQLKPVQQLPIFPLLEQKPESLAWTMAWVQPGFFASLASLILLPTSPCQPRWPSHSLWSIPCHLPPQGSCPCCFFCLECPLHHILHQYIGPT